MVVRYVDCKRYESISQIRRLLKTIGIKDIKEILKYPRATNYKMFYIFIQGNYVDTYYDSKDATECYGDDEENYNDLGSAIEWYEENYAEEHYRVYEELILQGDKIEIGTL